MRTIDNFKGIIICLLFIGLSSCDYKQIKEELSTFKETEKNELTNTELTTKFLANLDAVNTDSLITMFQQGAKVYFESDDPVYYSDLQSYVKNIYASFPDYKHQVENIFAKGDKVVVYLSYSGTFSNQYADIEPNGLKFQYKAIQIIQFNNGKISNIWFVGDELSMLKQLGLEFKPKKKEESYKMGNFIIS